ncbi:hypothetical protein BH10PSE9_BH10PSE9_03360 [soil metagenome]
MVGPWRFHGHAIVSADDRIAGADGLTPQALRNEADWARFQAALDRAAVTVLGRFGHEANPNLKRRNRLVLSSTARGLERRADAWWWNPAETDLADALVHAAPDGGIVVVPGGRRVFDLFLGVGYDAFDLARAERVTIPDGVPIFSAVAPGITAADLLVRHGLVAEVTEVIDTAADISLARWVCRAVP